MAAYPHRHRTTQESHVHLEPLHPVGVRVSDVDLTDPRLAEDLPPLLAEHGVAVLPGQHDVDDDVFVAFLRRLGDPAFTTGEVPLDGYPDLNLISNVGRTTAPVSNFHVDTSYVARPPAYTALRAVRIPERGGATQFTNQYRAYETLPEDLRESLEGRLLTHVVTGVELGPDDEASADHPVFRPHPVTGRRSLYLTSPGRCRAISGMDADETGRTVSRLLEHSTDPANTLDHAWSPGDVVVWDNAVVLHRADHAGVVGDRVMHRGMVATYPAAASA